MLPRHLGLSPFLSEEMLGLLKGFLEPPLPKEQCLLPGQAGTRARVLRLPLCPSVPPVSLPAQCEFEGEGTARGDFSVLSISVPRFFFFLSFLRVNIRIFRLICSLPLIRELKPTGNPWNLPSGEFGASRPVPALKHQLESF